jgi:hypothetical protein
MMMRPGTMKPMPPTIAPSGPASRQPQKIASWVDAGPGSSDVAAMPSSNSASDSQAFRCTHSRRSSAMCAGGPPKPVIPIRVHSRAITERGTGCVVVAAVVCSRGCTQGPFRILDAAFFRLATGDSEQTGPAAGCPDLGTT